MSPSAAQLLGSEQANASPQLAWREDCEQLPDAAVEALLRGALARTPQDRSRSLDLAGHLYRSGRFEAAGAAVASLAEDGDGEALRLCGEAALALDRPRDALDALTRAKAAGAAKVLTSLLRAAVKLGDADLAADLSRRALAASPEDHFALHYEARRMLRAERPDRLDALCEALRRRGARNAALNSIQAAAKARLGEETTARTLLGQSHLSVARGPDVDLDDLAREILGHPNLQAAVPPQATLGGRRVNRPLIARAPSFVALVAALKRGIAAYASTLGSCATDWAARPLELNIWAVVMAGDAVQDWHVHPSAVISGVFHVTAPQMERDEEMAGVLQFGLIPFDPPFDDRAYRSLVSPAPGKLALFPSSYAHRVAATRAASPRISVAFDVLAA